MSKGGVREGGREGKMEGFYLGPRGWTISDLGTCKKCLIRN